MKRLVLFFAFCTFAGTFAYSQTLADAAREQQAKKKTQSTGHVYTNESMEFHAAPPDATPPAKSDDSDKADAKSEGKTDKAAPAAADDATSAEDKKKAADAIKEKFTKQQADIVQLQRELDVLVRENKIRAAVYYSDAGARLRDQAKFDADDRKYATDIAAKQKAIADGQANLEKIREEARRAGVPLG